MFKKLLTAFAVLFLAACTGGDSGGLTGKSHTGSALLIWNSGNWDEDLWQ